MPSNSLCYVNEVYLGSIFAVFSIHLEGVLYVGSSLEEIIKDFMIFNIYFMQIISLI